MSWWQLSLEVPAELSEAAAWLLAERLEIAVEVQDDVTLERGVDTETHRVTIGLPHSPDEAMIVAARQALAPLGLSEIPLQQRHHDNDDWQELWKASFHRSPLSARVWVRPPWEAPADPPAHTVIINPGMAFGTGQHATTRLAMQLLDEVLADRPPLRVLDVGAGSGILAIGAALLGHSAVAVENDPETLNNARENLELNGVADRVEHVCGTADELSEVFPVVVANIIAPVLIAISADLRARAGADLVLSGMLLPQIDEVRACFPDFEERARREDGEWGALHLRRRAP